MTESGTRREWLCWVAAAGAGSLAPLQPVVGAPVRWIDRRNYGVFQCTATFPLAELDAAFGELAQLESELQRTLAIPSSNAPIDVLLFKNQRQHQRYLAEAYPKVPYRRALFVQSGGRSAVYAYRHADLPVDLRHECTHALLHAQLAMVPLWLDEGLAEYFEMPEKDRAFGHPHLRVLQWPLRLGFVDPIARLEEARSLSDMGPNEYRCAWAWAHFMLHGPAAAHRALVLYLADIRRGNPPGRLSERLEAAVPDLDRRIVQHFKHWRR